MCLLRGYVVSELRLQPIADRLDRDSGEIRGVEDCVDDRGELCDGGRGGLSISRTETGLDGREAGAYLSSCFFGHWCLGGGQVSKGISAFVSCAFERAGEGGEGGAGGAEEGERAGAGAGAVHAVEAIFAGLRPGM